MGQLGAWIETTQQDISAGIQDLATKGIVDSNRVCILGRAYDGYMALTSAVVSPDSYACAISVSGFSDLNQLIRSALWSARSATSIFDSQLVRNNRHYDGNDLDQFSPINNARAARAAFLLIDGRDRGWRSQSERMATALRSAQKHSEYIEITDENGDFQIPANRARMLTEIDRFLATHIGR
jgi:dipeptidyl aminopeptidase/acylaminoacyl peptidase